LDRHDQERHDGEPEAEMDHHSLACVRFTQSTIRKSGDRFSEKIMLKRQIKARRRENDAM
jgi:hypothetical protein